MGHYYSEMHTDKTDRATKKSTDPSGAKTHLRRLAEEIVAKEKAEPPPFIKAARERAAENTKHIHKALTELDREVARVRWEQMSQEERDIEQCKRCIRDIINCADLKTLAKIQVFCEGLTGA